MRQQLNTGLRLAVFASGGGSNFQAILDNVATGNLPLTPVLCVSNTPKAGALARAERHGIETLVLNPGDFTDEAIYAQTLLRELAARRVTFVALAGYLRKIPAAVVSAFRNRMVNIHPSLLPAFGGKGLYGRRVHESVLRAGVRATGATVHLVSEEYDTGPIVLQESVPVCDDDTPAILEARVLEVEHRLYPRALRLFSEGRVTIEGTHVRIQTPS